MKPLPLEVAPVEGVDIPLTAGFEPGEALDPPSPPTLKFPPPSRTNAAIATAPTATAAIAYLVSLLTTYEHSGDYDYRDYSNYQCETCTRYSGVSARSRRCNRRWGIRNGLIDDERRRGWNCGRSTVTQTVSESTGKGKWTGRCWSDLRDTRGKVVSPTKAIRARRFAPKLNRQQPHQSRQVS